MSNVALTPALRQEYEKLFNTCIISEKRLPAVEKIINKAIAHKQTYLSVSKKTGIPWYFIAVVHSLEASQDFGCHLHNGDSLSARTIQVPAGRPKTGNPPFTWEESAIDALTLEGLPDVQDWGLVNTLYLLERYNGFGYRTKHPDVLSPYLWSFSNHYTSGKYIADGTWSATAKSSQAGAAVLLRRMLENGTIEFPDQPLPTQQEPVVVQYSTEQLAIPEKTMAAIHLQQWLNTFPGIFVKIDGIPGPKTSDAYKIVSGHYLPGDPRN